MGKAANSGSKAAQNVLKRAELLRRPRYTLQTLARAVGVTVNTIRNDVHTGVVPHAEATGGRGGFTQRHLRYALAVDALRKQGLRGDKLRARIDAASPEQIAAMSGLPPLTTPKPDVGTPPRETMDVLLWGVATAMDAPPKIARAWVEATCRAMADKRVSAEQVLRGLKS